VHRLGSSTVNWYLVEADGRFTAVDAGLPGFKKSLDSDLGAVGASFDTLDALILTHSDGDHIGLARTLQDSGVRVLIHSADDVTLRKPRPKGGDASPINTVRELWRPSFLRFIASMLASGGGRIHGVEGAETFAAGETLDVPGRPKVIATPGHTPGHCAFHFEDHGALFVGDAMCTFNPITGSRGPQLMPKAFNESNASAFDSLDALEAIEAETMLFGHGEPWHDGVATAVMQAKEKAGL
jgi:glyoxylase-like metal-dependent hydrolase (beta-lactamase superfamily II)